MILMNPKEEEGNDLRKR